MGISWQESTCPYCGYGCGVLVGMEEGKITQIKGLPDHPANFGKLCMLMLHYPPIFYDAHRLKYPLKRTNSESEFERISWDTAEKTIKWKQHHALEFEQKPMDLIEFRIFTKNQQIKYIEHRCTFIISDVGDFSGIRVSNRDISLRKAKEEEIKKLEELLSICSHCKKIRDEEGTWHQMEEYMSRRKNLSFSTVFVRNAW